MVTLAESQACYAAFQRMSESEVARNYPSLSSYDIQRIRESQSQAFRIPERSATEIEQKYPGVSVKEAEEIAGALHSQGKAYLIERTLQEASFYKQGGKSVENAPSKEVQEKLRVQLIRQGIPVSSLEGEYPTVYDAQGRPYSPSIETLQRMKKDLATGQSRLPEPTQPERNVFGQAINLTPAEKRIVQAGERQQEVRKQVETKKQEPSFIMPSKQVSQEKLTASDIVKLEAGQGIGKPTLEALLGLSPYFIEKPKETPNALPVLLPNYPSQAEQEFKKLKKNVFWENPNLANAEVHPENFFTVLGKEKLVGETAGIPYFEEREGKLFEITPYSQKYEQTQTLVLKPDIKKSFEEWNVGAEKLEFFNLKISEEFTRQEKIQSYLDIKETGFSPQRLGIERERFKVARERYPSNAELAFFVKGSKELETKHWENLGTAAFLGIGGLGGAGVKGVIAVGGGLVAQEVVTEKSREVGFQLTLPKLPSLEFYPYTGEVENVGFFKLGTEETAQVVGLGTGLVAGVGAFKGLQAVEKGLPAFVPAGKSFFNTSGYWSKGKEINVELKASFVEERQSFDVGTTIQVGEGKEYGFFGIKKLNNIEAKSVFESGFNLPETENQALNKVEKFLVESNKVSLEGVPQSSQVSRSLGEVGVGKKSGFLFNIEVATPTKNMLVEDLSKQDLKHFLPSDKEVLRYQSTSQTKGALLFGKELEEKSKGYFTAGKTELLLEQTTQEADPFYFRRTGVGKVSSYFGGQVDEFSLYSLKGKGKIAEFAEKAGKKIKEKVNLTALTKGEFERASLRAESFGLDVADVLGKEMPKGTGGKMRFIAKRPNELLMDLEGQKNPKFYEGGRSKGRTKADVLAENEQLRKLEPQFKAMKKASIKKVNLIEKAVLNGENTVFDDISALAKKTAFNLKRKPVKYKLTTTIVGAREEFPMIEKQEVFGKKTGFTNVERLANKNRRNLNSFLQTQQKVSLALQKQKAPIIKSITEKLWSFEKIESRTSGIKAFTIGLAKSRQKMKEISLDVEEESVLGGQLIPKTISRNELRQQGKQFNFYSTKEINKSIEKSVNKEIGKSINKTAEKEISKVFNKEVSKPMLKPIERNIAKNINKSIAKEISKTVEKQIGKQISKTITKTISRPIIKPIIRITTKIIPFPTEPKPKFSIFKSLGFQAFVRKRGKFRKIGGIASFGKAFGYGTREVLGTAARTFKVEPTRLLIEEEGAPASRLPLDIFKQKKNLYIQRTGKTILSRKEYESIRHPKDLMFYPTKSKKRKGGFL